MTSSADLAAALAPRLPARLRLLPFHPVHAMLVQERGEYWRKGQVSERQGLFIYRFQAAAGPALSVCVGGELCACFGIFPDAPGVGELWMLITDAARARYPKLCLRLGRETVYVAKQYLLLTSLRIQIQRGDARALRYAERLGFHVEPFDDGTEFAAMALEAGKCRTS